MSLIYVILLWFDTCNLCFVLFFLTFVCLPNMITLCFGSDSSKRTDPFPKQQLLEAVARKV